MKALESLSERIMLFQDFLQLDQNNFLRIIHEQIPSQAQKLLADLYLYDPAILKHTAIVGEFAQILADPFLFSGQLNKQQVTEIALGGTLHDIGKQTISIALLHKRGKFSDEERLMVEEHAENGATLLNPIEGISPAVKAIVKYHHKYSAIPNEHRLLRANIVDLGTERLKRMPLEQAVQQDGIELTETLRLQILLVQIADFVDGCVDPTRSYRELSMTEEKVKESMIKNFGEKRLRSILGNKYFVFDDAFAVCTHLFRTA